MSNVVRRGGAKGLGVHVRHSPRCCRNRQLASRKWESERACSRSEARNKARMRPILTKTSSTGHGLGSGTSAGPTSFGPNWKKNWELRKIEQKEMTGLSAEQVKESLPQLDGTLPKEVKESDDWTYSKGKPSVHGRRKPWSDCGL